MSHHLVVGAGPVGTATARLLAEQGHTVTVLTRSGTGPSHPAITLERGDVVDVANLSRLAGEHGGAAALYNCVNPPYHRWAIDWPPMQHAFLKAAEHSGAVLVMIDNLYAFGFVDGARLLVNDPLPSQDNATLLSTGVGMRVQADPLTAALDIAVPLKDGASTLRGDERLLFSLRYGF